MRQERMPCLVIEDSQTWAASTLLSGPGCLHAVATSEPSDRCSGPATADPGNSNDSKTRIADAGGHASRTHVPVRLDRCVSAISLQSGAACIGRLDWLGKSEFLSDILGRILNLRKHCALIDVEQVELS